MINWIKYQTDRLLNQFEGKLAKKFTYRRLLTLPASHSTAAGTQSEDLTVTVHFPGIQFDLFGQRKDCISHQCLLSRKKKKKLYAVTYISKKQSSRLKPSSTTVPTQNKSSQHQT